MDSTALHSERVDKTVPKVRTSHKTCGQYAVWVPTSEGPRTAGSGILIPTRCHSWSCAPCARILAARWAHTLRLCQLRPRWFLTITLDPEILSQRRILTDYVAQRDFLRRALQSLWQWCRRHYGELRYWRAYEFHRGNWDPRRKLHNHRLHVHVLLECNCHDCPPGYSEAERKTKPWLPAPRYDTPVALAARRIGLGRTEMLTIPNDTQEAQDRVAAYARKYTSKLRGGSKTYRVRLVACSRSIRHARYERPPGHLQAEFVGNPAHFLVRRSSLERDLLTFWALVFDLAASCKSKSPPSTGTSCSSPAPPTPS